MTLIPSDIQSQCNLIQLDIMSVLTGLDDEIVTAVCQVVVDRCEILQQKMLED